MPLYSYECTKCNHTQEHSNDYDDRDVGPKCEKCNGKTERFFGALTFHLDGSDPNFVAAHDRWIAAHENAGKTKERTIFKPKALS